MNSNMRYMSLLLLLLPCCWCGAAGPPQPSAKAPPGSFVNQQPHQ